MNKYSQTKYLLIVTITLLLNCFDTSAQHDRHNKIKAYKTAFITEKLDLSSEEAERFWPIYNSYEKKMYQLRFLTTRDIQKKIREKGGIDAISNEEANQFVANLLPNEQAILDAKKKLFKDLQNVLSSKKILKLYRAEHEFNRELLSEFRKNKLNNLEK